jgi:hypothetical protein
VRTVIHVYGTARSGSTVVDLTLGNAPDAFSCGEVSAWFRPYRRHHLTLDCACGQDPCPVWAQLSELPESRFHATVFDMLQVGFVVDSSKDICWLIDAHRWSRDHDIAAVNLLLWKDPLDLAYSFWKRGHPPLTWRTEFLKCYTRFFETGLPFVALNYNEFARDPGGKLPQLCSAVGMAHASGRVGFANKRYHHLFGSAGIREQLERKQTMVRADPVHDSRFEAVAGGLEAELAADGVLQRTLDALRRADVSLAPSRVVGRAASTPGRPFWYYRSKTIRAVRRYFPQRYDPGAP